jgi:hypothetical protein
MTWQPIPGWEGHYEAHPDGLVRSLDRVIPVGHWSQRLPGRVLRPTRVGSMRYQAVTLRCAGRRERRYVHHLIAELFIGPRPDGLVICHGDGDVDNNAATNLRYDTVRENVMDTVRMGRNTFARYATKSGTWKLEKVRGQQS